MSRRREGFTLVEVLLAMSLMVTFAGALMSLILAGQSMARMQPEAADVQQRARVVLQTLGAELALAGAGLDRGPQAGPLSQYFLPVGPSADGGLTIWYVSSRQVQTALAAPLVPGATDALIGNASFSPASTAILFDAHGCHDVVRIDEAGPTWLQVRAGSRGCGYAAGDAIAQGEVRTYRVDAGTRQLLRRDEATGGSVPVLDNVAAMTIDYLDGGRRIRVTLRLAPATPDPRVPEFEVWCDVTPPNLRLR